MIKPSPGLIGCTILLCMLPSALTGYANFAYADISLPRDQNIEVAAFSPDGRIYCLGSLRSGLIEVGKDGVVKNSALFEGIVKNPRDVAVFKSLIVVLDETSLWFLDAMGRPQRKVTLAALGVRSPRAFCLDSLGYIYVVDSHTSSVYKLDPDGRLVLWIGQRGVENGTFLSPVDIGVDGQRNFYVADWDLSRIQKFNPMGQFMMSLGERGVGPGLFKKISSFVVDEAGRMFVADYFGNRVQVFDSRGAYLGSFSNVELPVDVIVEGESVYVLDSQRCCLREFTMDQLSHEPFSPVTAEYEGSPDGPGSQTSSVRPTPTDSNTAAESQSAPVVSAAKAGTKAGEETVPGETLPANRESPDVVPEKTIASLAGTVKYGAGTVKSGARTLKVESDADETGTPGGEKTADSTKKTGLSPRVGYLVSIESDRDVCAVDIRDMTLLPGGGRQIEVSISPVPDKRLIPRDFRVYEDRSLKKVLTVEQQAPGVVILGYSGEGATEKPQRVIIIVGGMRLGGPQRIGKGTWTSTQERSEAR